ncbi:MAG TPA: SPFH domain-containing protein [Hyphomicrobiaceae bacterium]|nr:SPFH domain-containing protein [Hyphomicrobiaceae bacterium]
MTMPAPSVRLSGRHLLLGVSIIAVAALANGSWFRVRQNEVAYVTRFGEVVNGQAGPLQPGLHFKLPLVDQADTITTSTDTVKMPAMKAFTRDTQEVALQLSLTYNVPPSAAYHLLYEVGRAGNVDIAHNLESVANDRVRSIVSRQDVTALAGEGRERIVDEIKATIASELKRLFKVEVQDVQIPTLDFSSQYKEAVNRATLARAQRVQAEQDRERARVEAETVVVKAKGEADSQYARAEGQARAQLAQARAEAEATKLRGEADASAIRAKIEAAGGVDGYARQLQAQATLNWKGGLPQIVAATAGGQFPLIVPLQLDAKAQ